MLTQEVSRIKQFIKENDIEFIDLKTIDLVGRLHHITIPALLFSEKTLTEGTGFDGSSYGFAKVEESDMVQIPDTSTMFIDPFREKKVLSFFVNVHLTDEKRTRYPHDVRYIAQKAEQCLKESGIADTSFWGPEFEFHILHNASFKNSAHECSFVIESHEQISGNAYHACNPHELYVDFRDEASSIMTSLGIPVKYHHHEVGREGQMEIELLFSPLKLTADYSILSKYILFSLAKKYNLKLTFMPKPIFGSAGNGMHVHQFLTKEDQNIFYQKDRYANLSDIGRFYIGGILKHAKSLTAIANPTSNSYKRLVRGFEAPVSITFGQANRTSAIRIPKYVSDPSKTRMEYRAGDATTNPYLYYSALLMAGIDGIINKYDPETLGFGPYDKKNLEGADNLDYLPQSLPEALNELQKDHEYLLRNNVFDELFIKNFIAQKKKEYELIANRPHPMEHELYFGL